MATDRPAAGPSGGGGAGRAAPRRTPPAAHTAAARPRPPRPARTPPAAWCRAFGPAPLLPRPPRRPRPHHAGSEPGTPSAPGLPSPLPRSFTTARISPPGPTPPGALQAGLCLRPTLGAQASVQTKFVAVKPPPPSRPSLLSLPPFPPLSYQALKSCTTIKIPHRQYRSKKHTV